MDNSWKQDPRLKAMNKDKLAMLTEFAERIEHSDKNNMMEAFMAINMEARQKGVQGDRPSGQHPQFQDASLREKEN